MSKNDLYGKYEKFVRLNPRLAAEIEAIVRWSSYLVATRKSPVLGELLSSGANLMQICNDIILRQANSSLKLELDNVAVRLKTCLSVIQSLELLAEIYAREHYGTAGKWAIIASIQVTKAAIKLLLLLVYDGGLARSQSITPLDRIHYAEIAQLQEKFGATDISSPEEPTVQELDSQVASNSKSIVLKSSGRKLRSITESTPKQSRFGPIAKNDGSPFNKLQRQRLETLIDRYREHRSATLTHRQLCGEVLHISRPIAHLLLIGAFGPQSWTSYFTSFAMDLSSLYLVRSPLPLGSRANLADPRLTVPKCLHFNANERMELGQRAASLLLYMLRSPFFDEFTKKKALEGLSSTADCIPLVGGVLSTFVNYIPSWQKDYFRVWAE